MPKKEKRSGPVTQLEELHWRVAELEETLRAIRMGEVDAVLISGPEGERVFTLQGAEHPYRVMVETIDEGAATLAGDGAVLYANRSFAKIFDVPLEKLIGSRLSKFVFGEDRDLLDTLVSDANGSIARGEFRLNGGDQQPRTIRLTLSPVREQEVHTICVVATDLTELMDSNEALRRSELSLSSLSARLLKLQDEERRRIARDLHDTTGQKIAVLGMNLDRLAKIVDLKKDGVRDALAECRETVANIGDEIRTLSYLLHPPLLDESGLASAVHWYAEGFAKRSGIQVDLKIDEDLVRLPKDAEVALFRVLQESLTNVLRYSGSPVARIKIFQTAGCVHLEVIDHGKGAPAASANVSSTAGPSLGVGIPGMRERIRQLGGQLDVEFGSQGTRVHALLPVGMSGQQRADQSSVDLVHQTANKVANSDNQRDSRIQILIADDHPVIRNGLRRLIDSQEGWHVCGEAEEGVEAVRKTKDLNPDLVILDISMPGLSGITAARLILKDNPNAKILFFTEHNSPEVIRQISELPAEGPISKSRTGNDLVDAVRAILAGRKSFSARQTQRTVLVAHKAINS
jgi:two-component system, NarL family, sensor kinase